MALLAEYALTPDVFDVTSYSSAEVCGLHLQTIRETLLTEALVRDLRESEWRRLLFGGTRVWHRRGTELVKKLAAQGRLVPFGSVLPASPVDDREWCREALGTHAALPFTGGVIVTQPLKQAFEGEPLVSSIDGLGGAPWWAARSPSVRLRRTIADYQIQLDPVLRCANSILLIDPHLDPSRYRYRQFGDLLTRAGRRRPMPLVEIHRVAYEGSGPGRVFLAPQEIERRFREVLDQAVRNADLEVEVFVWDDFHYRHVITNVLGILMENGFDTTNDPGSITTWARLGRGDRDAIQREFDPASRHHVLRGRFRIP